MTTITPQITTAPDRAGLAAWLAPLLALLAGLAAYANCFGGVFLFDDLKNIVTCEAIRSLSPIGDVLGYNKRTLVTLSLAINWALGESNPVGYHVFNLAVHLGAGLALYGVTRRTLQRASTLPASTVAWIAGAVAMLWIVHPLQTGAVTYTIQRAESMMGLFYLLTLYTFIRGVQTARPAGWYVASAMCCAAGMLCKAIMITAPAMMLLYDWVFVGPTIATIVRRRWGVYLGYAAAASILVFNGLIPGILNPVESRTATVGFKFKGVSPAEYARSQPGVILYYLRLVFWPQRLCLDYQWPVARHMPSIVMTGATIGAALLATAWGVARRHWLGFLGAWFFVILAPTSSIVPVRDLAFEHRMYLSLAAVIAAVVIGAALGLRRLAATRHWPATRGAIVGGIVLAVATIALAARTHDRNRDYTDPIAMWENVVDFRPDNARAWNQLGNARQAAGRFDEAIAAYEEVTRIDPTLGAPHAGRAACYAKMNDLPSALAAWEAALPGTDNQVYVRYHLATTNLALQRTATAITHFEAALELDPDYVPALLDLGQALAVQGRPALALDRVRRAIELDPDNVTAHFYLGHIENALGNPAAAIAAYRRAVALDPNHEAARLAVQTMESQGY